jgi:predicted 3-demethylubiquinone-9 3-methyltransferase (glyoxalase superfamily)
MNKITPCLWFDDQAEEAAKFYTSIFKDSKIMNVTHYGEEAAKVSGRPKGSVMTVTFRLDGQEFMALNGGPIFPFTEAISLMVNCDNQQELDEMWRKLVEGGQEVECGWLKDKYGLSWQIVPRLLGELMKDTDQKKVDRVMGALLQMKKLDIDRLKKAYAEV